MPKGPKVPRVPPGSPPGTTVEQAWQWTLRAFKRRRQYEGQHTVAKIKKYIRMLLADADLHYREADASERFDYSRRQYTLKQRAERLYEKLEQAGFHKNDPLVEDGYTRIADAAKKLFRPFSPDGHDDAIRALREYAREIAIVADEHRLHLKWTQDTASVLRTKPTGATPRGSMHYLLRDADAMNISDIDLARRLAAEKLIPDGPGADDSDLVAQWFDAIKSARYRARKKAKALKVTE